MNYIGFAPKENSITDMMLAKDVEGTFVDDKYSDWNAARVFELSPTQYTIIASYINEKKANDVKYNIETNNCTTFAIDALRTIISYDRIGINKHNWTIPDNLGGLLESYSATPDWLPTWLGEAAINNTMGNFYGYTPADAVQDLIISRGITIIRYDSSGIKSINNN